MTDLDKAREWASGIEHLVGVMHPDAQAAIEVIQSLPDHWVDAEKVREVLFHMREDSLFEESLHPHVNAFERLLAPKLLTLADMTAEEREACEWMQCMLDGDTDERYVLMTVDDQRSRILLSSGDFLIYNNDLITPLPDLPKLEWPGDGVVDAEIVEEPEATDSGSIHTPMQPSEVPPNEPWLIEADGRKAIGTRYKGDTRAPWAVAALDGVLTDHSNDSEITLIHKLVPETHALPEGMRLADHEKFGRVVTSPWGDGDDDYKIFFLNEDARGGADYDFAHESELTFLDGDK